jgi:predicted SAM-dependent methyltransferase
LFHYREVVAARRRDQARQAQSPARSHSQPMNRDASADVAEGFSCRRATGRLPHPLPSPLVLNLGCGADIRPDMVNIDLFSDHPSVVGMDVRHLELPDGCADLILASDVLEHFSHREVDAVLAEWSRVLKPGGEIVVRCPSLRLQVQAYLRGDWDADVASYMIFGGQTNPGDYHTIAFDQRSIRVHLSRAGLEVYDVEEQDIPQTGGFINLNMVVRARKTAPAETQVRSRDLHARAAGP